jgi:hypothetical protein
MNEERESLKEYREDYDCKKNMRELQYITEQEGVDLENWGQPKWEVVRDISWRKKDNKFENR